MSLKLLLGLGNPEPRYEMTRHNAGFKIIDELATRYGASLNYSSKLDCELAKFNHAGHNLILAKPTTYMNLSGHAARAIMSFYKIEKNQLLVLHDEVALPLGQLRLARNGGSAGNHGIESIIECLGHKDFERLRLGVGPDPGGALRASFVLARIEAENEELYFKMIKLAAEAVELYLKQGLQKAMNTYNGIDLRPQAEAKTNSSTDIKKSTEPG